MNKLDELFPKETQSSIPLNYQLITKKPLGGKKTYVRHGKSSYYSADRFSCNAFYKPISKPIKK